MKKKKRLRAIWLVAMALLIRVLLITLWYVLNAETLLFVDKGELIGTHVSPAGDRCVYAYLRNVHTTVAFSVYCAVEGKGVVDRNIYWQYRENEADIVWLDNDTVCINGVTIDVRYQVYDYRQYPDSP